MCLRCERPIQLVTEAEMNRESQGSVAMILTARELARAWRFTQDADRVHRRGASGGDTDQGMGVAMRGGRL